MAGRVVPGIQIVAGGFQLPNGKQVLSCVSQAHVAGQPQRAG